MDLTMKVSAKSFVVVRMGEDGTVEGKVVGVMEYAKVEKGAGPQCSADVELTDEEKKEVGDVLSRILKGHQERLAMRLGDARAEARRVAKAFGELI